MSPIRHRGARGWLGRAVARLFPGSRRVQQRGVALIAVTVALAICLTLSSDFGTQTSIDTIAAANSRDQLRAHFMARSALEISRMVLRLQRRVETAFKGVQITDFANTLMAAFCGSGEEFRQFAGVDVKDAKGLGMGGGAACGVTIVPDDDGKLNLNCANDNAGAPVLASRIDALYYYSTYDPVFEQSDADGWRRNRQTQTAAILDYVDRDNAKYGAPGTPEDYGYENLHDPYLPKNNYLDTVGELKLVRGVDDRFWTLFGDAFTVYGSCKSNINAMTNPYLIASTMYLAAKDKNDPALQNPAQLWMLANLVIKARTFFITFDKVDDFVKFARDPLSSFVIPTLPGQSEPAIDPTQILSALGIPPGMKLGIELDKAQLEKIAVVGKRRTYRVEAWGEAIREQKDGKGNYIFPPIRRTIRAVWDFNITPQAHRPSPTGMPIPPKGSWVYLREE